LVKTLILRTSPNNIVGSIASIQVQGTTTQTNYYNQAPYLIGNLAANWYTVVVPVNSIIDGAVTVTITVAALQSITLQVFGDTAQYDESVFYNGAVQATTVVAAGTIKSGPFRLISVNALSTGTGAIVLSSGGNLLVTNANGLVQEQSFPPNLIVPAGVSVNATGAVGQSSVVWAYP
jgi:hypothetical protein